MEKEILNTLTRYLEQKENATDIANATIKALAEFLNISEHIDYEELDDAIDDLCSIIFSDDEDEYEVNADDLPDNKVHQFIP